MPIAAVPAYLGGDFKDASPGMRFGMYLKLWGVDRRSHALLWETHDVGYEVRGRDQREREVKYENKVAALGEARRLNANDISIMRQLLVRQMQSFDVAATQDTVLRLDALATAPFTTGLGNEHPLENGFAFLNPYGLPYLPGSGIKGVLRQAARELASGQWGETAGWDEAVITSLFGCESANGGGDPLRGALIFWDVIPQMGGDSLAVEIMTPHQTHYYQQGATPHESGQPTPISFLTVPPGSRFVFHMQCDLAHLSRSAPELARDGRWKRLLDAAFLHAFDWLGFGAKTAVGYGAMAENPAAQVEREQREAAVRAEVERQAEDARRQTLSPEELAWEEQQPVIEAFSAQFEVARKSAYKPGSLFDQQRGEFVKVVLLWEAPRGRKAAAVLLRTTMSKAWGMPGNKDSKQRLKEAIDLLDPECS